MVIRATSGRVIIRIKHEQRKALFEKQIQTDSGETLTLVTGMPIDQADDGSSKQFVRTAEVINVGRGVLDMGSGDVAILDYLVSNQDEIMIHQDEHGKYYSVFAQTTYEKSDVVAHEDRRRDKPMYIARQGDVDLISQVIGVVRGSVLIAKDPYVILGYEPQTEDKETASGIVYKEKRDLLRHEILAVSPITTEKFGFEKGMRIIANYSDCFEIELPEPFGRVLAVNDVDILARDVVSEKDLAWAVEAIKGVSEKN